MTNPEHSSRCCQDKYQVTDSKLSNLANTLLGTKMALVVKFMPDAEVRAEFNSSLLSEIESNFIRNPYVAGNQNLYLNSRIVQQEFVYLTESSVVEIPENDRQSISLFRNGAGLAILDIFNVNTDIVTSIPPVPSILAFISTLNSLAKYASGLGISNNGCKVTFELKPNNLNFKFKTFKFPPTDREKVVSTRIVPLEPVVLEGKVENFLNVDAVFMQAVRNLLMEFGNSLGEIPEDYISTEGFLQKKYFQADEIKFLENNFPSLILE